jgi:hypothetical protein
MRFQPRGQEFGESRVPDSHLLGARRTLHTVDDALIVFLDQFHRPVRVPILQCLHDIHPHLAQGARDPFPGGGTLTGGPDREPDLNLDDAPAPPLLIETGHE